MQDLKIAELARAGGVGVETVRYYQRRGLLETPERPGNGGHSGSIRRYGDRDVRKLRFIRSAQAAGFTLEQIAELIALDATEERARQMKAFALPSRQLRRENLLRGLAFPFGANPQQSPQSDLLERTLHLICAAFSGEHRQMPRDGAVTRDVAFLRDVRHSLAKSVPVDLVPVHVAISEVAACWLNEPDEAKRERALSGAVRARER